MTKYELKYCFNNEATLDDEAKLDFELDLDNEFSAMDQFHSYLRDYFGFSNDQVEIFQDPLGMLWFYAFGKKIGFIDERQS